MSVFKKTTHLSEILEKSEETPLIIFKYSNDCNTSSHLAKDIEQSVIEGKLSPVIYIVTVQTEPVLSRKIEEWFQVKHETPQMILLNKGKLVDTAHHKDIQIEKFIK